MSCAVEAEVVHVDKSRKTEAKHKIYKMLDTDSSKFFRQHLPTSKSSYVKACEATKYNPKEFTRVDWHQWCIAEEFGQELFEQDMQHKSMPMNNLVKTIAKFPDAWLRLSTLSSKRHHRIDLLSCLRYHNSGQTQHVI